MKYNEILYDYKFLNDIENHLKNLDRTKEGQIGNILKQTP
jgi:hypothetical protein